MRPSPTSASKLSSNFAFSKWGRLLDWHRLAAILRKFCRENGGNEVWQAGLDLQGSLAEWDFIIIIFSRMKIQTNVFTFNFLFLFNGVCQAGLDLQGGHVCAKHLCLRWNIDCCGNICSFEIIGCLENIYSFWNIGHSVSTDCFKFLCKKLTRFKQHPLRGEICHCRHCQRRCKIFCQQCKFLDKLHILWRD